MVNILITSTQHFASFQLASLFKNDNILFGDSFAHFPKTNSPSIAHEILTFCLDHQIDQIYPLRNKELDALAESVILFNEFGIEVMLSSKSHFIILDSKNEVAESFTELSSKILALGYPKQKIAIANAQHHGDLILIDDENRNFNQVYTKLNSVSFIQLGKLFNQNPFVEMALYQLKDELKKIYVLVNNGIINYPIQPSAEIQKMIEQAIDKSVKGFYQVDFSDQQLLRIKNAAL